MRDLQGNSKLPVVIDCSNVSQADFTAAEGFREMLGDFSTRGQSLYWMSVSQPLLDTLVPAMGDRLVVITGPKEISEMELSNNIQETRKTDVEIALPSLGSILNSEGNTRNA